MCVDLSLLGLCFIALTGRHETYFAAFQALKTDARREGFSTFEYIAIKTPALRKLTSYVADYAAKFTKKKGDDPNMWWRNRAHRQLKHISLSPEWGEQLKKNPQTEQLGQFFEEAVKYEDDGTGDYKFEFPLGLFDDEANE